MDEDHTEVHRVDHGRCESAHYRAKDPVPCHNCDHHFEGNDAVDDVQTGQKNEVNSSTAQRLSSEDHQSQEKSVPNE